MPQMITALFRDPAQARQALQSLLEMGIAQNRIVAVGNADAREISSISGFRSLSVRDDALDALHDLNRRNPTSGSSSRDFTGISP
jgi:hypothetical protein